MKIIFYSTNSNLFNKDKCLITVNPSNESQFETFKNRHKDHDFLFISQTPAMFMPEKSTIILDPQLTPREIAQKILNYKPDMAIAMSFWVNPYDWLTVNDALVAEFLENNGVKTICQSVETGLVCFDKWRTHQKLLQLHQNVPSTIYVDHDLYFCAGSHKEVINNVYKESVLSQIKKMTFPLIIKDTCGLSSYGMTVVKTYGEAVNYLNSKRNNSNRLIQEYIQGEPFGLEIYGIPGKYTVFPPFKFSLTQYGITSPKQSVKTGPEKLDKKLKKQMLELAQAFRFMGCTQIDLIKKNDEWLVIEINPRLSGMSFTYAKALGFSIFDLLFTACVSKQKVSCKLNQTYSIKLPLIDKAKMDILLQKYNNVLLNQINDLEARQEREKGFCECIVVGNSREEIVQTLINLNREFSSETTIQQSQTILKQMGL